MSRPYFILGTPRSRTAWLAASLSKPERPCQHEPSRFLRDQAELVALLRTPDLAVSDSALTFRWRDIRRECPGARIVVVRRPIAEVIESAVGAGLPRTPAMLRRLNHEIDLLCGCLPVLSVPFHRLDDKAAYDTLFEFCRGHKPAPAHFNYWQPRKIVADVQAVTADARANIAGIRNIFPEIMAA